MKDRGLGIAGEFHCHNKYSNGMDPACLPFDSSMSPLEQLRAAYKNGLDFFFITNHNTTDGYEQFLKCQKDHPELEKVKVYCGEEISALSSIGNYGHVLGWGLSESIDYGLSVAETADEIRSQGAISCAAHPYGLAFGMRDNARLCDLIEVFNSGNIDKYSDIRAQEASRRWGKFGIAGSDAHLPEGVGKCVVRVHSDNNMEDILDAVRHGRFVIEKAEYNSMEYFKRCLSFSLSDPSKFLSNMKSSYGWAVDAVLRCMIKRFMENPDSFWVNLLEKAALNRIKNISMKLNIYNYDCSLLYARAIKKFAEVIMPPRGKRLIDGFVIKNANLINPQSLLNNLNEEVMMRTYI